MEKDKNLDFSKNFTFLINNKSEILFKSIRYHLEVESNNIESTTLFIDYIHKNDNTSQVLCFYGSEQKKQIIDHLTTFFKETLVINDQNKLEKILTFLEILFHNVKNHYQITNGNFYLNMNFPSLNLADIILFKGIINNKEYTFEKQNIEFNEFDIFYPSFLIEDTKIDNMRMFVDKL